MLRVNDADTIKIAAVLTAAPRWIMALLRAEGLAIPEGFYGSWLVVNFILAIGMAVTEALAINFIFNSWRNQKDRKARNLMLIMMPLLAAFLIAMTPSIMASAYRIPMEEVLGHGWLWVVWSASVGLSTILAVAGVGYASKDAVKQDVKAVNQIDAHESDKKESRRASILTFYSENPEASVTRVARDLGVSRQTVYNDLEWLVSDGELVKTDAGWLATASQNGRNV